MRLSIFVTGLMCLLFSCTPKQHTLESDEVMAPQTLLVLLKEGTSAQKTLSPFEEIDGESIKAASLSQNLISCVANLREGDLEAFLSRLEAHDKVIYAKLMPSDPDAPSNSTNTDHSTTKPIKE